MTLKASLLCSTPQEREALLANLASLPGVQVNAHVGSARTLLSVMQDDQPDLVLLDLPLADEAAFEQIEAASLRLPGVLVMLVSPDPSMDLFRRAMRAGVRNILPAPLGPDTVRRAVEELQESQSIGSRFAEHKARLLAFLPAMGGAGSTFLAGNLGYNLAAGGKKVLLIDLNLHFGNLAAYVSDQKPASSILEIARRSRRLDSALLASSVLRARDNLHVLAAPELPQQAELLTPEVLQDIIGQVRSEYDFVILDVGRTLDPMGLAALELADLVYLVVQLTLPAVHNTQRIAATLQGHDFAQGKFKLVVNRYLKQSLIRLDEVERITKTKVERTVPGNFEAVMASINQGVPLQMLSPRDAVARALQEWKNDLSPVVVKQSRNWFAGLTGLL
ncbi:MAG: hypothetical protein JWR74_691 [Polaromonas sp.]|jgi:pilus assembly protein CpaE|nr:hypothetical protein [Polaromonas sp.]